MSSIFQKAKYTEQEAYENGMNDEGEMWFNNEDDFKANIAFMERDLEYHLRIAKQLKELLAEKKEIVKEKLQNLKENKELSKEEKEKKKRKIMNHEFSN